MRILVIEDNRDILANVLDYLQLKGPRCQDSCRLIGFIKTKDRGRKELCNAALLC